MKLQKRGLAIAILVAFCLCLFPEKAMATEAINSISIKVVLNIEAGDRLPDIQIDKTSGECYVTSGDKKYTVRDAKWITSTSKDMTVGEEPRLNVTLTPSDEYDAYFKSSYEATKMKITGGAYVSAKRNGSDLIVTLRANPVKGLYAEPEDVGWKDTRLGQAVWSKGDNTSGAYELWLYCGKKLILKKEQVKATTYNFYPYMTEEGTYSFKIRSVPYKQDELKNGKKSGWVESDELVIRDRDVSDGKGKDSDTIGGTTNGSGVIEGWNQQSGVWYYRYADGTVQANSWLELDDVWYRFDQEGKMVTGWFIQDPDIFYTNSKGAMVTGWNKIDNTWYYFYPDKGYEAPMGAAATNWQVIDGYYYYFNSQGAMQKDWINQAGRWYYLNTIQGNLEGAMLKGWITRNGYTYFTGEDGVMVTGWQKIDGLWRYFNQNGTMAVNTVINGFPVNEDGGMGALMKEKRRKLFSACFAMFVAAFICLPAVTTYAADSVVIRSVNLKFDSQYGNEEILMPGISTTTAGVSVKDVVWKRDISKWKAAGNERVSVFLTSDTMVFAEGYNRSECKLTGAKFVSAKAVDNHTLEVKVDYVPVVILGRTSRAGWSDSKKTKAVWEKVEFATGYQVALYADDKLKTRISVGTNTVDLSKYMDKDAVYYYEVRAIGFTSDDRKYMKDGDYVTSEDVIMEYDGDTSGAWKGNTYKQEDGGVPRNSWKQILNDWYYFDGNGVYQTGWILSGQRWYYTDPKDGKLLVGWQFVNGKWYYLNTVGGEMLTGWIEPQPGIWYYMNPDGSMASGTNVGNYWVDASGRWIP